MGYGLKPNIKTVNFTNLFSESPLLSQFLLCVNASLNPKLIQFSTFAISLQFIEHIWSTVGKHWAYQFRQQFRKNKNVHVYLCWMILAGSELWTSNTIVKIYWTVYNIPLYEHFFPVSIHSLPCIIFIYKLTLSCYLQVTVLKHKCTPIFS